MGEKLKSHSNEIAKIQIRTDCIQNVKNYIGHHGFWCQRECIKQKVCTSIIFGTINIFFFLLFIRNTVPISNNSTSPLSRMVNYISVTLPTQSVVQLLIIWSNHLPVCVNV